MPVDTDDLRAAIPSLYPDNLNGEIDAARMRQGQRLIADVIDEAIGKTYSDEAKTWAQSPTPPDPLDFTSKSAKTWATQAGLSEDASAASAAAAAIDAAAAAIDAASAAADADAAAASAAAAAIDAASADADAATAAAAAAAAAIDAASADADAAAAGAAAAAVSAGVAAAAISAAAAEAAYDSFNDRYLGDKSANPALDNDGSPLLTGALYFNTTLAEMRVYTGAAWVAAYASLGSALVKTNNLSDLLAPSQGLANLHGYATTVKSGGTTTLTAASAVYQRFTGSLAHSVVLPDAGTLQLGSFYDVHNNNAPGTLTVKSADASTIAVALPGQVIRLVCILASGSTTGSWGVTLLGTDVLGNAAILASTNTTGIPSGRYLVTATTGGVLPAGWLPANGGIIDILRGDAGAVVQLLYCGLTGRSATRHLVGGLWQPWREAITVDQSPVAGDMMYFDGSNFLRLAKGTAGQALTMNAGATAPEWRQGFDASGATAGAPRLLDAAHPTFAAGAVELLNVNGLGVIFGGSYSGSSSGSGTIYWEGFKFHAMKSGGLRLSVEQVQSSPIRLSRNGTVLATLTTGSGSFVVQTVDFTFSAGDTILIEYGLNWAFGSGGGTDTSQFKNLKLMADQRGVFRL